MCLYFFLRGHGNESRNLIVLRVVRIFLFLATGNDNAFVNGQVYPYLRCRSVLGKTVPSILSTQDLVHSLSPYGPPGWRITDIYLNVVDLFCSGLSMYAYVCVMYLQQLYKRLRRVAIS